MGNAVDPVILRIYVNSGQGPKLYLAWPCFDSIDMRMIRLYMWFDKKFNPLAVNNFIHLTQ